MTLRTIALALTAAIALPTMAAAQATMDSGQERATLHATITAPSSHGWLTSAGPDAQGRYAVRVSIADLNPASPQGWAAMQSRAERAAIALCDMAGDPADMKGFHNAGARQCRQDTTSAALGQMQGARAAAANGTPVATIGIAARVAAR